jgi:tRNA U55 pseudouridine synthase TruB
MEVNKKSYFFKGFNGVLLINKPPGETSYGVIRKIKKVFF